MSVVVGTEAETDPSGVGRGDKEVYVVTVSVSVLEGISTSVVTENVGVLVGGRETDGVPVVVSIATVLQHGTALRNRGSGLVGSGTGDGGIGLKSDNSEHGVSVLAASGTRKSRNSHSLADREVNASTRVDFSLESHVGPVVSRHSSRNLGPGSVSRKRSSREVG